MTRASTSVVALAACVVLHGALLISRAQAEEAGAASGVSANAIHFELPAQPLSEALRAYGSMTELTVIARANLLDGLTSAPVNGNYSPREALQHLLAGTGLQANFTGMDEAVIARTPLAPPPSVAALPVTISATDIDGVADDAGRSYAGMVQARLAEALCASAQTRPGNYRLVVQLRIGDSGSVIASDLVESTGLPGRDAAIEQAMRTLVMDAPPPPALAQPITILVRPRGDGLDTDCNLMSERN
jgi:hypothetical protein